MIELTGSFDGPDLPKLVVLLSELGQNSYLRVLDGTSSGEVFFDAGRVVAASFGTPRSPDLLRGLTALDAMAVLVPHGRFVFSESASPTERNIEIDQDELRKHLRAVVERSRDVQASSVPLTAVPSLVYWTGDGSGQLILTRGSANLLRLVDGQRPIHELIDGRDFLAALRDLLLLLNQGLIHLELPTAPIKGRTAATPPVLGRTGAPRTSALRAASARQHLPPRDLG